MPSVGALVLLWLVAGGMASLTAVAVRWAAYSRSPLSAGAVQFILVMMAGMFVGVLVYFAVGGTPGYVAGFWVAGVTMSAAVFLVFVPFLRAFQSRTAPEDVAWSASSRARLVASVVGLVIVNEFLMGWSFSLLSGLLGPGVGASVAGITSVFTDAITSPWFVFPMALEMLLTLRWLLAALPRSMRPFVAIQPAVMVCSPPTLGGLAWGLTTSVLAAALMSLAVALFLRAFFRDEPLSAPVSAYASRLIFSFGLMSAGLLLWAEFSNPVLFALALLVQMVVFLHASTDPSSYGTGPLPVGGQGAERVVSAEIERS